MPARFRILHWKRQWSDLRIVWISVAKLDLAWQRGPSADYFEPGSLDPSYGRYARIGKLVEVFKGRIWMPTVSPAEGGAVSFTDGRHRFSWMRDYGIKHMPVGTSPCCREELRRLCGTRVRTCRLPLPVKPRLRVCK